MSESRVDVILSLLLDLRLEELNVPDQQLFEIPYPEELAALIRRRSKGPCDVCGRRPGRTVIYWQVHPEYREIMGTPPGEMGVISVALCAPCARNPDILGRAKADILGLVEDSARAKGLPMPPTPEMPAIDISTLMPRL
jgi:hypothetical protein